MKKALFFLLAVIISSRVAFAAEMFVPGTQDIPLMEGLEMNAVPNIDFDTPAGQLLAVNAVGKHLTGQQVLSYYNQVLPQMGWVLVQKGRYKREEDTIALTVLQEEKPAVIRFETASLNAK